MATESQRNVKYWVECALEKEHLENVNVEISPGINGDGYLGDISFVKVTAERNGKEKVYNLVLKFSKDNDLLRKTMPIHDIFHQEIHLYDNVFPSFNKFLIEKGQETLDFVPRCYKTVSKDNFEIIVLDNLKALGYELYDKSNSMNVSHVEEVLKTYGKWHALSFAIEDQKKKEYDALCAGLKNVGYDLTEIEGSDVNTVSTQDRARQSLLEEGEHELLRKFDKLAEQNFHETFKELTRTIPDKTIISHGDCWNNNFMFKYGQNRNHPEKVAIIDWQMSYKRSPVSDISYFLYAVSSTTELDQLDRLLKIYYKSLSENIRKLGSDPEKLFPFQELMNHWRKYSLYGFISGFIVLPYALCEKEDAPKLSELNAENSLVDMATKLEVKNKAAYNKRIYGIVEHYTRYHNIL